MRSWTRLRRLVLTGLLGECCVLLACAPIDGFRSFRIDSEKATVPTIIIHATGRNDSCTQQHEGPHHWDNRLARRRAREETQEPGNERAPFYDLEPTTRALGWRPTIDLNANAPPLKRRPVVLVVRTIVNRIDRVTVQVWWVIIRL